MFIYCFDEVLKNELLKTGYKMIQNPSNQDYWVFINKPEKLAFNFSDVDKNKFKMSNRLNF